MTPTFNELGVPEPIIEALARRGINEPFEIQSATIADALAGRDVCGRAPTGSGKTLAFGIPLVAQAERAEPKRPRSLVLAPTRELADQIMTELRTFAGPIRVAVVYGGVGYTNQLKSLRKGVDILVACPGRLEDLIDQRAVDLSDVDRVVLDEADRMADMGFMPAVKRLLDQTRPDRQTVLFSATLDGDVAKLTQRYQNDPVRHEVGEETPDITAAHHVFWTVQKADRAALTAETINAVWPAIVFCRTRHGSDRLAKQLGRNGVSSAAIHGGRSQSQRTRALADFTAGKVHALVATDVAARGIHVDGVASVVHYDPPEDHKTYVHRSGRTARAGEGGVVVSLVQPDQRRDLAKLQKRIGLDEPFTDPDPAHLRDLSPSPTGRTAPKRPATPDKARTSDGPGEGQQRRRRRKNSSGSGKPSNGGAGRGAGQKPRKKRSGKTSGGSPSGSTGQGQGKKADGAKRSSPAGKGGSSSNRKARRAHLQPKGDR